MATVDEEEHAVLDRLTFDYHQKLQGKPQSHELVGAPPPSTALGGGRSAPHLPPCLGCGQRRGPAAPRPPWAWPPAGFAIFLAKKMGVWGQPQPDGRRRLFAEGARDAEEGLGHRGLPVPRPEVRPLHVQHLPRRRAVLTPAKSGREARRRERRNPPENHRGTRGLAPGAPPKPLSDSRSPIPRAPAPAPAPAGLGVSACVRKMQIYAPSPRQPERLGPFSSPRLALATAPLFFRNRRSCLGDIIIIFGPSGSFWLLLLGVRIPPHPGPAPLRPSRAEVARVAPAGFVGSGGPAPLLRPPDCPGPPPVLWGWGPSSHPHLPLGCNKRVSLSAGRESGWGALPPGGTPPPMGTPSPLGTLPSVGTPPPMGHRHP